MEMNMNMDRNMNRCPGMNCFLGEQKRDGFPLGMAYVPMQENLNMYDNLQKAYGTGTIFPDLDKPFTGRRCVR